MGLVCSIFYYQQSVLIVVDKYVEVKSLIQVIFYEYKGCYGYCCVIVVLLCFGKFVGYNVV